MPFVELGRAGVKLTGRPWRECPDEWLNEGGKGGGEAVPPPATFASSGRMKDHPLCFTQFAVLGNLCHNSSNTTVTAVAGERGTFPTCVVVPPLQIPAQGRASQTSGPRTLALGRLPVPQRPEAASGKDRSRPR